MNHSRKVLCATFLLFQFFATAGTASSIVTFSKQPTSVPENADLLKNLNGPETQFKWAPFTEQVLIDIDISQLVWLDRIELFAYATPTRNIDRIIVEVAENKNEYVQADVINCEDSRLNASYYSLKSKRLLKHARFIRLRIHTPFIEAPIVIHHVSIETSLEKPAFEENLHDSETLIQNGGATRVIQNNTIKVSFNSKSGEISGIYSIKTGKKIADSVETWSMLHLRGTEKEYFGRFDKVESITANKDNVVEFHCEYAGNKNIAITKRYILDSNRVIKSMVYDGSQIAAQDFTFITPAERLVLPRERIEQVVFAGGDPWYGPRVWPSDIISKTRQRGSGVSHCMMAMDQQMGKKNSLAIYRRRVNDRFCWPVSSTHNYETYNSLSYYPDGGLIPVSTIALHNQKASYETDILLFEGQEPEFVQAYSKIPDIAAAYADIKRPEWIKDISCNLWLDPTYDGSAVEKLRELLKMTERGDILVILNQPFIWGSFGETREFLNIWGARVSQDDYKKLIAELKSMSPRVKLALYSWIWTIAPQSEFFKEYKDCANVLDKNGQPFNAWPGIDPTHLRRMIDKPSVDALKAQYRKMVESYDVDFVYLDGGIGGSSQIDWQRGTVEQDYDWQEFYGFMRELSQKYAKSGMCFNSKSNPIADLGIAEMALGAFKGNTGYIMNYMWGGKLQERVDSAHRVIPCYWGFSDPWYSNICIGLGMIPHIEAAGLSNVEADFIEIKSHVITVAREMLGTVPNGVIPGLYPDSYGQKISGYALFRENADIFSLMNSLDQSQVAAVKLPSALTVARDRNVYTWQNELLPVLPKNQIYSESEQIEAYRKTSWRLQHSVESKYLGIIVPGQEKIDVRLNPTQLAILGLSNDAAVITAIDGLPVQLKISNVLDVSVRTEHKENLLNIQVVAPNVVKEIDLWCVLPKGYTFSSTDCNAIGCFWQSDNLIAYLRVPGSGKYSLGLTAAVMDKTESAQVICDSTVKTGHILSPEIKSAPNYVYWNILNERDQIVAVLKASPGKAEILVPAELHAGTLKLKLVSTASSVALWEQNIKVTKQDESDLKPVMAKSSEVKTKTQPVKDDFILAAATQETAGICESSYDVNNRVITAKAPRRPTSAWGFSSAGFEIGSVRWLKLKAVSNISSAYCIEHRYGKDKPFAGLIIDYKVSDKYAKRVALNCGLNEYHWALPEYGKGSKSDLQVQIADWVTAKQSNEMVLDLKEWAPPGWSGQCWISACLGNILPDRWISFTITDLSADKLPSWANGVLKGSLNSVNLAAFPTPYVVGYTEEAIVIDGLGNEQSWISASAVSDFRFVQQLTSADDFTTVAKLAYDANNLYVLFQCTEPSGSKLINSNGKVGMPWADDSVEIYLCDDVNRPMAKVIIGVDGSVFADQNHNPLSGVEAKTVVCGHAWSVEVKIGLKQLNMLAKKGKTWRANLCRNRPRRQGDPFGREAMCWARIKNGSYSHSVFFPELKFN